MSRPRPWLRHARAAAICLLSGVVLTVGVAWGLSLHFSRTEDGMERIMQSIQNRAYLGDATYGQSTSFGTTMWTRSTWHPMSIDGHAPLDPPYWVYKEPAHAGFARSFGFGWPFISLVYQVGSSRTHTTEYRWAWRLGHNEGTPGSLRFPLTMPLLVVWPGFAINVAFYGVLSWLLFFAPFTIRRAIRIKRGRCSACGYDLNGLMTCPECGAEA